MQENDQNELDTTAIPGAMWALFLSSVVVNMTH